MRSNILLRCSNSAKLTFLIALAVLSTCQTYLITGASSIAAFASAVGNPIPSSIRKGNSLRSFTLYDSSAPDPSINRPPRAVIPIAPSAEEMLGLDTSIASCGFLKNIEEYGKARMARRAVGILSKMPSYREMPKQEHYTAAIWACENSDQYKLAMGVFAEMKDVGVERITKTYEGLISVAEKTKNWEAAIKLFDEMISEGIKGSTDAYNSCIWAAEQGGRHDISLNMLDDMEKKNIARNLATYAACTYSCEKAGEGEIALHVMSLMKAEGYEINTPVYKAAIWACVKSGMWETSLSLFQQMEDEGILRDSDCYNGAIWACVSGGLWEKAVEFLKLMKFEGLPRTTISYDGALSALQLGGQWEACLDMITWMDREIPVTPKGITTYQTILQALDDADRGEDMRFIYLQALRDDYFQPWVSGSRMADFRGYTLPVAKAALGNILTSMKDGKLALFNLHIAVCDAPLAGEWTSKQGDAGVEKDRHENTVPSFDLDNLERYLQSLPPEGLISSSRVKLDGTERLVLSRDSLAAWSLSSPFYGYEDSRNVWVERQNKSNV